VRRRRGQSIVEYIILVAIFAIATIGIVMVYGDRIREMFARSADQLAGEEFIEPEKHFGNEKKTLDDFAKTDGVRCNGSVCMGGP
jgi:Flp pilus assembly pilin Flp